MDIEKVFISQKENYIRVGQTTIRERIVKLKKFEAAVLTHRERLKQAMFDDYNRPAAEVDLTEILVVKKEIRFAIKNIHKWVSDDNVPTPLMLLGARSSIKYESKGVVLIIAPWNYPILLTLTPLISAIAAGNCIILKPSEFTPKTAGVIKQLLGNIFNEDEVAVPEGGIELSQNLLKLPFNHIFFTGSSKVGKIVMKAAAEHHSSVTLELGGKSPAIVDSSVDMKKAAERIILAKLQNNGQICVTADYILAHSSIREELIEALIAAIKKFYGNDASKSEYYSRIIDQKHIDRLQGITDEAKAKGDEIVYSGKGVSKRYFGPTVIRAESKETMLSKDEIFGPILPVYSYDELSEAIMRVNEIKRPLALYIFSNSKKVVQEIIRNTRAGSTVVNASAIHALNPHLPFGGINNSGMGASHGKWGFREFSHARPIVKTSLLFNAVDLLKPPYDSKWKKWLIEFTVKYL